MTVCYLPKPSSPLANNIALPTSTMHHALTHSSLYGSLFLLPANLHSFAPYHLAFIPAQPYPPPALQNYYPHKQDSSSHFSLYGLRRRRTFPFPFYGLTYFSRPGRRDRTADLLTRHGLPYKRQRCDGENYYIYVYIDIRYNTSVSTAKKCWYINTKSQSALSV